MCSSDLLGVIGIIYESRPNVTIDISVLCLKSGNATVLRGGKEAIHSNTALAALVRESIAEAGMTSDVVQFIESTDRALVGQMLKAKGLTDLLIPRGGQADRKSTRLNSSQVVISYAVSLLQK